MPFRGFEMYLFILKEHFELFLYPITKTNNPTDNNNNNNNDSTQLPVCCF